MDSLVGKSMSNNKSPMEKWVEATIPMPEKTWNALKRNATKEGCSVSNIIKKSIIKQNRKRASDKEEEWSDIDDVTVTELLV